ncbi:uncharacterized protein [Argopecten irradians]|uniref:uncharacterized protein n=1 Tax=Argopecten irradians TaxID=31199 RepID=UPI0037214AA8
MDCGYDSEDQVSGFLNNVVDQSISDLMEEDEKNPQIDFGAQKPNMNQEFPKTKSLPSLETNVDSQKYKLSMTPSQPGINRRPTKVVMDNKDLRRNLLQRQYKQAVIDQRANKAPGTREEPDKPRKATTADLRLDPSSTSDQKPGQASPATDTETTDPSSSEKAEQDTEEDMDKNIDDFVNISLSSITKEEMLDEHVDDFVSSSLMRIVGDDTAMVLMEDNEKEMHQDVRSEDHKLGTIDIVGEAKKEIEQFHTDKDGHSTPTADINEKKVNDIEAKDLDLAETIDSAVPENKASNRSVFGFFIRRRSTGSLKLRYPCLQLVCGNSKVEDSDNFAENKNTSRTKKPGFLRRLFSCLRREGGRVDPRNDE